MYLHEIYVRLGVYMYEVITLLIIHCLRHVRIIYCALFCHISIFIYFHSVIDFVGVENLLLQKGLFTL